MQQRRQRRLHHYALPLFLLFIVVFRIMEVIRYEKYIYSSETTMENNNNVNEEKSSKPYFNKDMFLRNLNNEREETTSPGGKLEGPNWKSKRHQQQQQRQQQQKQQRKSIVSYENATVKEEDDATTTAKTIQSLVARITSQKKKYDDNNNNNIEHPKTTEKEEKKKDNNNGFDDDIIQLPQPTFNSTCIPTALTSYPGSGSTITRLLIEMATGVYTGSIYKDGSLYNGQPYPFKGELTIDNVVAIKTHGPFHNQYTLTDKASRAIMIVRNPYSAIPSYYNWWYGSQHDVSTMHQIQAPKEDWETWRHNNVPIQLKEWIDHFTYWMDNTTNYYPHDGTLFIIKFEDLINKANGPKTLQSIGQFLDFPSSIQTMQVIWSLSMNISSGIHRPKSYHPKYKPPEAKLIQNQLQKLYDKYGTNDDTFVANILDEYINSISKYIDDMGNSSSL